MPSSDRGSACSKYASTSILSWRARLNDCWRCRSKNERSHGGFREWRSPKWMVFNGKSRLKWMILKMGNIQNQWFWMEHPIKTDDLGVPPWFGIYHIWKWSPYGLPVPLRNQFLFRATAIGAACDSWKRDIRDDLGIEKHVRPREIYLLRII